MQRYHPSTNLQDALVGLQPARAVLDEQGHRLAGAQPKRGEGGRRPLDRHMLLPVAELLGRTGMGRIESQLIAVLGGQLPPRPLEALQSGDD